jgi:hypothetical protein
MIKVYKLRDKTGFTLQAAKTPFGILLFPEHGSVKRALSYGYTFLSLMSLKGYTFKEWNGGRYKTIGIKMVEYNNDK